MAKTWDLLPDGRIRCFVNVGGKAKEIAIHRIDHRQQQAAGAKFYVTEREAAEAPPQALIPAAGAVASEESPFESVDPEPEKPATSSDAKTTEAKPAISVGPQKK